MPTFQIKLTQVYRTVKAINVMVLAPDAETAKKMVDRREVDVPTIDDDRDKRWRTLDASLVTEELEVL